ncbi:DUF1461 domain-containing protein [Candidatus Woesearchaeota archaeon]|nr:DUF1461 domain-containing protein [Candidatus Woesearchaeota archaeon]
MPFLQDKLAIRCLLVAAAILLSLFVFLSSLVALVSGTGYLGSLARSTSTWGSASPSPGSGAVADLMAADAISYVTGKSGSIAYGSYFRQEELYHLSDVRGKISVLKLFFHVVAAALAISVLSLFLLVSGLGSFLPLLRRLLLLSGLLSLAVIAVVSLLSLQFDAAFTAFHSVFFSTSSQWQFPSDYLLVNLFTADFFAGVTRAAVAAAFVEGLALVVASLVIGKFYNPKAISVKA